MPAIYLGRLGGGEMVLTSARVPAESARALDQAKTILDAAYEEAEYIRNAAREQGFSAGIAAGQAEIAALLSNAQVNANRYARDLEPVLADCVARAVRMLVGEVEPDRLIERAVLRVRERLADTDGMVLRVPPAQTEIAQAAACRLTREQGLVLPIRVVADAALRDDACVIESSLGRAEVRLEDQLARMHDLVQKTLAGVEQEP